MTDPTKPDSTPDQPAFSDNEEAGAESASGAETSTRQIELNADLSLLTPEQREDRKRALKTMLAASEARTQNVQRKKIPTPTLGIEVRIARGPHANKSGVIQDADYIHNRVLLELTDSTTQIWVDFSRLAPEETED